MESVWRWSVVVLLATGSGWAWADGEIRRPEPSPRTLEPFERAAVELVAQFSEHGAEAWWDRLAADSPLRALGRAKALREISVRLGPRHGSKWTLETPARPDSSEAMFTVEFPSGAEDRITIEFTSAGDAQIRALRCLADPPPPSESPDTPATVLAMSRGVAGSAATAAGLTAFLLVAWLAVRSWQVRSGVLVGLLVACGSESVGNPSTPATRAILELRELTPLRDALTEGRAGPEATGAALPEKLDLVRRLWTSQLELMAGHLESAEAGIPADEIASGPLADLLRARIAMAKFEFDRAAESLARAAAAVPAESIRYELVLATLASSEAWRSEVELELLLETGPRRAEPWLHAARFAVEAGEEERSESLLETGWSLRPLTREELLTDVGLASLAARPGLFPLFGLDRAEPAVAEVRPYSVNDAAVRLPEGFSATLCGRELRLESGNFEILVPGGAEIAPPDTRGESAESRAADAERRATDATSRLIALARGGTARLEPRFEHQAILALRSLARAEEWTRVLDLASAFFRGASHTHPEISRYRAVALDRQGREAEALEALIDLAERELGLGRPAPDLLAELAEALSRQGDHERAFRLAERAAAQIPIPRFQFAREQYRVSRDLGRESRELVRPGVEVRSPRLSGDRYPEQIAAVLELERQRLARWIPQGRRGLLRVELYPLRSFLSVYGFDVGGVTLSDGRVRVPFADLRSLHPKLVAILSHELAHAMLFHATQGRSPRWFHEGLAQHVEMGTGRINPIPELERQGRTLAFPVLEFVLEGFAEPALVEIAYAESAWTVHFLEARWGVNGLHRLQAEFARGAVTAEALRAVTGLSLVDFDREFRRWARDEAPAARSLDVRDYETELNPRYFTPSRG